MRGYESLINKGHFANNDSHNSNPLYVSPSDAIMSPASQKLSSFKQRQINKQYVHLQT